MDSSREPGIDVLVLDTQNIFEQQRLNQLMEKEVQHCDHAAMASETDSELVVVANKEPKKKSADSNSH